MITPEAHSCSLGLTSSKGNALFVPVSVTLVAAVTYALNPTLPVIKLETAYTVSWAVVAALFAVVLNKGTGDDVTSVKKKLF